MEAYVSNFSWWFLPLPAVRVHDVSAAACVCAERQVRVHEKRVILICNKNNCIHQHKHAHMRYKEPNTDTHTHTTCLGCVEVSCGFWTWQLSAGQKQRAPWLCRQPWFPALPDTKYTSPPSSSHCHLHATSVDQHTPARYHTNWGYEVKKEKLEDTIWKLMFDPWDFAAWCVCVPVLQWGGGRGVELLQALLEQLFVLVDEMSLHLWHLSHDLLPPEPRHLRFPLPLRLILVPHRLHIHIYPLRQYCNLKGSWRKGVALPMLTSSWLCPELSLGGALAVHSRVVLMVATVCRYTKIKYENLYI